jgi:two-component system, sensor histidine kinase and response regulator
MPRVDAEPTPPIDELASARQEIASLRFTIERYRLMFENQGEGIALVDLAERFVMVNPAAERIFGVPPGGLDDRRVTEFLEPAGRELVARETRVRAQGRSSTYLLDVRRPDGAVRSLQITAVPALDAAGQVEGAYAIFEDVTERLRAERALAESRETLKSVLEASADGLLVASAARSIVYINKQLIQMWRMGPEVMAALDLESLRAYILAQLGEGQAEVYLEGLEALYQSGRNDERVLRCRDGRLIERHSRALVLNEQNLGRVWSFRDITQRVRGQQALQHQIAKLAAVLDHLSEGVLLLDREGKVAEVDRAFCELSGIPRVELIDRPLEALPASPLGAVLQAARERLLRAGTREPLVEQFQLGERTLLLRASAVRRGPALDGLLFSLQEVTEFVRARQAAEAANQAKGLLLANLSHEIRTPLNGLLGMLTLSLDSDLDPDLREHLELAQRSGGELLRQINQLLDFSRLEAGHVDLSVVPFSLAGLLTDLAAPFHHRARARALTFELALPPDLPRQVRGDPVRLRQVLTNLLDNALKFTERGGLALRAEVLGLLRGAWSLRFSVWDSGIGISAEALGRIFQPFVQVDPSSTRRRGGTGLGLSISAELVRRMGGRIAVDSSPGHGSTFWVELNLVDADAPEAAREGLPVLDRTALEQRTCGDRGLVLELAEVMRIESGRLLEQLSAALASGDGAAAISAVHSLGGAAGNLGGLALADAAWRVLEALRQGAALSAAEVCRELDAERAQLLAALEGNA